MLLEFQREFAGAIGSPAEGPMRIYRNTAMSGCVDALRSNYPIVARLLGDELFDRAATEHAAACPPRKPVLALYGARFPDWLEAQPWVWEVAYVADVARVERLYIESLFAADAEPLGMHALRDADWQSLHLTFHPATRFEWLSMPAMSIWQAQRDAIEGEFEPEWHPEGVLLTRPTLELQAQHLDRAGYRFLFGIRLGESVGEAALTTANLYPEADIGSLFTSLVTAGTFVALPNRSLL